MSRNSLGLPHYGISALRDIAFSISRGVDKTVRDVRYQLANDRVLSHQRNGAGLRMYMCPYVRSIQQYTVSATPGIYRPIASLYLMPHIERPSRRDQSF